MKVLFTTTYRPVTFGGINDAVRKITGKIKREGMNADTFTPSQDGGTVIIENYYETGSKNNTDNKNSKKGTLLESTLAGAGAGTAASGASAATKKTQGINSNNTQAADADVDTDDTTPVDMLGENGDAAAETGKVPTDDIKIGDNLANDPADISSNDIDLETPTEDLVSEIPAEDVADIGDIEADAELPEIEAPEIETPEIEIPEIELPDIDLADIIDLY